MDLFRPPLTIVGDHKLEYIISCVHVLISVCMSVFISVRLYAREAGICCAVPRLTIRRCQRLLSDRENRAPLKTKFGL